MVLQNPPLIYTQTVYIQRVSERMTRFQIIISNNENVLVTKQITNY